jgi:hypothetical protein
VRLVTVSQGWEDMEPSQGTLMQTLLWHLVDNVCKKRGMRLALVLNVNRIPGWIRQVRLFGPTSCCNCAGGKMALADRDEWQARHAPGAPAQHVDRTPGWIRQVWHATTALCCYWVPVARGLALPSTRGPCQGLVLPLMLVCRP